MSYPLTAVGATGEKWGAGRMVKPFPNGQCVTECVSEAALAAASLALRGT
jgi:hypothetical protein